jgi:flagellar hook-associated protein 1
MTSTFLGFETAVRALRTHQFALDVTNHNVANANTAGYSRQTAQLSVTPPYTVPGLGRPVQAGQLGTGVEVSGVQRSRDPFLDARYRIEVGTKGQASASYGALQQIEGVFNEPGDNGLSSEIGAFFNAWQDVSSDPSDTSARVVVVQKSVQLSASFRRVSQQLSDLRTQINDQVGQAAQQLNGMASQIATLNKQIVTNEFGGQQANDLRDQRDALLDQMAQLVQISTTTNADGSTNVLIGGRAMVQGFTVDSVVAQAGVGGMYQLQYASDNAAVALNGGTLKGLVDVRDQSIPGYQTKLDGIVGGFIIAVNGLHSNGYALDGSTGRPFFTGTDASTIAVNPAILSDPRLLGAADAAGQAGNGAVSTAIAQLRRTMSPGPDSAFGQLVGQIGTDVRSAQTLRDSQAAVVDFIDNQRQSVSGVSLDEEAVDLLRHQRAYEAAARVMTTIDQMLDKLINETGIVGR